MKQQITVEHVDDLHEVSDALAQHLSKHRNIILLHGDLGAGKTALVKDFTWSYMGVEADSPTFNLVNTYENNGKVLHHFDLYRLEDVEEIEDIGFWDYIDSGDPCFIEWPDKIAELLPIEQCIRIDIKLTSNQWREYLLSYV